MNRSGSSGATFLCNCILVRPNLAVYSTLSTSREYLRRDWFPIFRFAQHKFNGHGVSRKLLSPLSKFLGAQQPICSTKTLTCDQF